MTRAALLTAALVACACGPVTIVVGTTDGGTADDGCTALVGCNADSSCERGCHDVVGVCELKPIVPDGSLAPVCGCDEVTYLNDSWRRHVGTPLGSMNECRQGPGCDRPEDCPPGSFCLKWSDGQCTPGARGRCWSVPPTCPQAAARLTSCTTQVCHDFCQGVRTTGDSYLSSSACP